DYETCDITPCKCGFGRLHFTRVLSRSHFFVQKNWCWFLFTNTKYYRANECSRFFLVRNNCKWRGRKSCEGLDIMRAPDIMRICENIVHTCDNIMQRCDDIIRKCDNITRAPDIMQICEDIVQTCDNIMQRCEHIMHKCDNITQSP